MNKYRPLSEVGLPAAIVSKLLKSDFVHTDDVMGLTPIELSSASGLTLKESVEVIKLSTTTQIQQPTTALQMIEDEGEVTHVVTFCEALDGLLGGGLPLRAITEVCGPPGVGKTQLCMQACVSVQLPSCVGGVEGEAVFVDTEGSFSTGRLKDMATHAMQHVQNIHSGQQDISHFTLESILKRIHYFRCHNYIEIMAVIKHLPTLLRDHPRIQLLVLDSVAFHFRYNFPDMMARTGLLCRLTQELIQQAVRHNMAVVLTNQMTTRVEGDGSSQLVPALGETWSHCPTLRLTLHWAATTRHATLTKAPHRQQSSVTFQVTVAGIRDVPASAAAGSGGTRKRKLPSTE